jgi:hypothetical protein
MTPNVYEVDTFVQINSAFVSCDGAPLDPSTVILWVCDPVGAITQVTDALVRITPGVYAYQMTLNQIGVWTYKWQGEGTVEVTSPDSTMIVNRTVFAPPLP